ncbi:LCP family protein [Nakamurella leprariae]|uniref:LCP family protein n=1 Tax=Nakamurella leprariae TaxID=2803911 RepID=A0A939BYG3_9ACTN|nr:LCP family protein [Nakamurella leprariae]MBM9466586.1 LCP family protein [Nakamurella leprariae]
MDAGTEGPAERAAGDPPRHGPTRHRARTGWLNAGRVAVAVVSVAALAVTGLEWTIKARADQGLVERQVDAIVAPDRTGAGGSALPTTVVPAGEYTPENILLLGSDTRAGTNGDEGNTDASTEDGVANSDTLMLAHISSDRHVTVLSIPRDTMIDAPQCLKWNSSTGELSDTQQNISRGERWHINSAYAVGGPQCTVRAVQNLTGLQIDRVIGIDFSGFKNMVDALGGITVDVCGPIIDAELGAVVAEGGVQVVRGDQALSLVRARKVQGDTDSDLSRIRRQQVVLSAILQQVTSAGTLLSPAKLDGFLQAFVTNTYTDNVSIDSLVALAESFGDLDPAKITFFTLPTISDPDDPDELIVDETKAPAVFEALRNDQRLPGEPGVSDSTATSPASPSTSAPAPSSAPPAVTVPPTVVVDPAAVSLAVVNSTGRTGMASSAAAELEAYGFVVDENDVRTGDRTVDGTVVEYGPGRLDDAVTVAAAVPGAAVAEVADLTGQVRLVLGTDHDGVLQEVTVGEATPDWVIVGAPVTATEPTAATPTTTLTEGDLAAVNAGQALCA